MIEIVGLCLLVLGLVGAGFALFGNTTGFAFFGKHKRLTLGLVSLGLFGSGNLLVLTAMGASIGTPLSQFAPTIAESSTSAAANTDATAEASAAASNAVETAAAGDAGAPIQTKHVEDRRPTAVTGPAAAPGPAIGGMQVRYNHPPVIPLGSATTYRLIILSGHPLQPNDFKGAPGPIGAHGIPSVRFARAELHGPVKIEAQSAPCQQVTDRDNPTWDWQVTPTNLQPFNLTFDIYEVEGCTSAAPIDHRVDSFPITVQASLWAWLIYVWPVWKTVLASLLGVIAAAGGALKAWSWIRGDR